MIYPSILERKYNEYLPFVTETATNDYLEIKIKRKLASEINNLFATGKLPDELQPKDMNRLCDNLYRLLVPINKEINNQEIQKNIEIIKTEVQSISLAQIPRSVSLFQYFLSILIRNNIIEIPIKKYHFHITEEVTTLYPDIKIDNDCIFIYSDDT